MLSTQKAAPHHPPPHRRSAQLQSDSKQPHCAKCCRFIVASVFFFPSRFDYKLFLLPRSCSEIFSSILIKKVYLCRDDKQATKKEKRERRESKKSHLGEFKM
jgi:hypothetical protein